MKRSYFINVDAGELRDESDCEQLIESIYRQPHVTFYVFHEKGAGMPHHLRSAEVFGVVQFVETRGHYYKHPNFQNDWVQIIEPSFDWERTLLANEPMYFRTETKLSEHAGRRRELREAGQEFLSSQQAAERGHGLWQRLEAHGRKNPVLWGLVFLVLALAAGALIGLA